MIYFTDGSRDAVVNVRSRDIALKSASAWKRLGAKPYEDDSGNDLASECAKAADIKD
jgi:hypothetical protein